VRAEDAGKRGVELLLDATGRIFERAAGLLERCQDPVPFAGDLIRRDRRGIGSRLEQVHHEPRWAHPDAGGDRGAREGRGIALALNEVRIVLGHGRVCIEGHGLPARRACRSPRALDVG
jgi:hypothetical protein